MAKKKKKSKFSFFIKLFLSIVLLLLIIGGVLGYSYYKKIYTPNVKLAESKSYLYIPTGSNFDDLISILNEEKMIVDMASFEWLAEYKKYKEKVKPGRYRIKNNMSNNELVNLLRSGEQEPIKLVLRSYRLKEELAGKIGANLECDSTSIMELLSSRAFAESYGFNPSTILVMIIPNTYEFYWNTSPDEFFKRMAKEYKAFWTEERKNKAHEAGLTQTEVSILASIVQQESWKTDEMPKIAGVYINRLKKGMLLQADPTVVYAVGDFSLRRVLKKHLAYESPYNTYIHEGLPPGPICIPWPGTIDAVLDYSKHQYIFFCAKEDFSGYHNFAKTNAEHEKNASKYQQALNKRKIK